VALKALQDVQDAERRAEKLIEQARLEGQSAQRAAEQERQGAVEQARTQARQMVEKEVSGASEKAREKIGTLREQHVRELDGLHKKAAKNVDRAVEIVLEVLRKI